MPVYIFFICWYRKVTWLVSDIGRGLAEVFDRVLKYFVYFWSLILIKQLDFSISIWKFPNSLNIHLIIKYVTQKLNSIIFHCNIFLFATRFLHNVHAWKLNCETLICFHSRLPKKALRTRPKCRLRLAGRVTLDPVFCRNQTPARSVLHCGWKRSARLWNR